MRVLCAAAAIALLTGPTLTVSAYAQMPQVNLMPDVPTKTQEEKDADEVRQKAYKESLKKIPDAKAPSDPWGSVRSTDTPASSAKSTSSSKPKAKSGTTASSGASAN